VALLVVAGAGAIGADVYKTLVTLSFEQTDGAIFKDWVFAEFGTAAAAGFLFTAVATIIFAVLQRRHWRFAIGAPIAAVLLVASLIGGAALSSAHRSHPIVQERAIARSVPLPANWGPGSFHDLPQAPEPLTDTPPRVDRIIDSPLAYEPVCRQLLASLTGWSGAHLVPWGGGSPLGPLTPNLSSGIGCTMLGTSPQGWPVMLTAFVQPTNPRIKPAALETAAAGMTRVIIQVSTPTR
jgi:hypothetical protein